MENTKKLPALLTCQEVSGYLKVTPQYVRKLIKEKKISATRAGNQWIVKR